MKHVTVEQRADPYIACPDRDRLWALQMLSDWSTGMGRGSGHYDEDCKRRWVDRTLRDWEVDVERIRSWEALNPAPF